MDAEVDVGVLADMLVIAVLEVPDTPTQYASLAQNPLEQSDEIAGFHSWKWSFVIPNLAATVPQSSPARRLLAQM